MLRKLTLGSLSLLFMLFYQNSLAVINKCADENNFPFYLQIGAGYSFSLKTTLSGIDPPCWDPAVEGYDSDLGSAPSFEVGLGYHITPCLSALISSSFRGGYHYEKFQTPVPGSASFDSLPSKTRYFDLDNTNVMFSLIANGAKVNGIHMDFCNGTVLAPFIGAGIGVARNEVYNFHSVLTTSTGGFADVASDMTTKKTYSFAAQGMVGASWLVTDRTSFDLGYRFYYGGQFKSNDYVVDISAGAASTPWKGNLLTNEVFLNLRYDI